jgi:phage gpG-like protein
MRVDVVVRGDEQAERLLGRLARRLEDGTPQLLGLVDQLIEAEQERFAGRGIRWRRLAPSTSRQGRRPLVLTGELMRSLTVRGYRGQIVEVRPGQLRFGTRVYYARFHQKGEGVPKRTVVGLTRIQKKSVVAELRSLLLEDL